MNTKTFLLLFSILTLSFGYTQPVWQWAKTGGGTGASNSFDVVYGLAKDASNNVYSCGTFHGTSVPIGNGTYTATLRTPFITKKDSNGNPIWQFVPTCSSVCQAYSIAVDASGDVIVCGQYSGTITFGATVLTAGSGSNSVYIAKLNGATGVPIWAVAHKSNGDATSDITATGVATHTDGTIYVCGNFKGTTLTFNSTSTYTSTMNGAGALQFDGYLVKLNTSGATQWVRRVIGPTGSNNSDKIIYDVAVDANGNPVGVGSFKSGSAIMYPGTGSVGNTNGTMGAYDGFLAAWQADGTNIGISKYGSATGVQNDYLYGIELLPDNNFAICGAFNNVAHLKKINATTQAVISSFQPSNGNGSAFYVLDSDNNGNIYSAGILTNPATFGTTTLSPVSAQQDALLVKINTSDAWAWAINYGTTSTTLTNDLGRSIVALGNDDLVVGGAFSANMALGTFFLAAAGNGDFYEARYAPCTTTLTFTGQPSPITVCEAATATISITTSSAANYQWYKNGNAINGATSSSYSFLATLADQGATFYCTATGPCGTTTSNTVSTTVQPLPTISTSPSGSALCVGDPLNLAVTANNATSYQWKQGGTAINGATSSTYTIASVITSNAGTYNVTAINSCGSVNSNYATITVNSVPTITLQPASYTQCLNAAYTLSVGATGGANTYQWYKDGNSIAGANATNYYMQPVSLGDAGTYYCIVTNNCGSVTSNSAIFSVITAPAITADPISQTVCSGYSTTFSVTATGSNLSYQWKKNGTSIGGATSASYTINSTTTANAGTYTCTVSGNCGSPVTSNGAVLTVNSGVSITTQPQNQNICSGAALNLSVTATGTGLSYQWKKNGSAISGATSATYTVPSTTASNDGSYTVDITSSTCGTLTSNAAIVSILSPVSITSQPSAITVCEGNTATLSVTATGSGLTYQWKKNGTDVNGATSATLTYPTVATSNAGTYSVVITGTCSSSNSSAVTLTVNTTTNIYSSLTSQTLCEGGTYYENPTVYGTNLSYQWYKNGTPHSTATSLHIPAVTASDAGNYSVTISGACGTVSSNTSSLIVNTTTQIAQHPVTSLTMCSGESDQISVTATGTNLSYQWQKDNSTIVGATNATYNFENISSAQAGTYTVTVVGTCGTITSNNSVITVNELTEISATTLNQSLCEGEIISMTVSANGSNLLYQWLQDGNIINGETNSTLTISNSTMSDNGNYTVTVNGSCGSVTSDPIALTILTHSTSTLTLASCDAYVLNGQTYTESGIYQQTIPNAAGCDSTITLNLTINAVNTSISNDGTTLSALSDNMTYQWIDCINNQAIANATGQSFTPVVTGNYAVIVSNGDCSDTSDCELVEVAGIGENETGFFSVYPNPTTGTININAPTISSFVITNSVGQVILKLEGEMSYSVNLQNYSNGVYFINNHLSGHKTKIVKQ